MKNLFFYIFVSVVIISAPRVFAQSASNSDFDPFPQMEQDQNSVDTVPPQQQNDDSDAWPPPNAGVQANSDGAHE